MSTQQRSDSAFKCPSCGRALSWRQESVGQPFRCSCGAAVVVPQQPQSPAVADDAYDLCDDPPLLEPLPDEPTAPDGSLPTATAVRKVLKYQPAPVAQSHWRDAIRGSEVRHLVLPAILLVLAAAVRLGVVFFHGSSGPLQTIALLGVAVGTMAINVLVMLVGVGAVARFTGSDLGPLPIALIKLTATAIAGSVVMAFGASLLNTYGMSAGIICWHITLMVYWIMFSTLFEMDLQETLFAVAIVGILNALTMIMLWQR